MLFSKLARLLYPLAIMTLLAVSCGSDTTIDTGTETAEAGASNGSSDTTEPTAVPPTAATQATAIPPTAAAEPTAVPPTVVPPTAVPEPTASAAETDEAQDATEASDDDDAVVFEDRDDAVAFFVGEGLITRDAECLADSAFRVFGTWDFDDVDPTPEQDEELDEILDVCITVVPGPAAGSPPPGTNAELDVLWVSCDGGSAEACDDLFWQAPTDSDYEAFGLSCGGRAIDECSDVLDD